MIKTLKKLPLSLALGLIAFSVTSGSVFAAGSASYDMLLTTDKGKYVSATFSPNSNVKWIQTQTTTNEPVQQIVAKLQDRNTGAVSQTVNTNSKSAYQRVGTQGVWKYDHISSHKVTDPKYGFRYYERIVTGGR